jgi:hypothetical protein
MSDERSEEFIRANKMLAASLTTMERGRAFENIDIAITPVIMVAFLWVIFVLATGF